MPWLLLVIKTYIAYIRVLYSSFRRTDLTTGDMYVFYSWVGCDCYIQLFKVTKKVLHCMCLLADFKAKGKAKIRNEYNQEPHPTRNSIWESENTHTRKHKT